MNFINSFLINSTLVLSFFLISFSAKAYDQIDYALNIVEADPLAFYDQMITSSIEENTPIINSEEPLAIQVSIITPPKTRQMVGRESITFILGKDQQVEIPFYEEAFYYFANHPYDQTEFIITSCNSLLDVRNYLASFPTRNALPWSTINIVLSPNEVSSLSVPIFPQGTKSTIKNLAMTANQNEFPSLSSNQIDQWTSLYIHGAEVKKDSKLSYALHKLLFAKEDLAIKPIFMDDTFVLEQLAK